MHINNIELVLLSLTVLLTCGIIYLYIKLQRITNTLKTLTKGVKKGNLEKVLREYLKKLDKNTEDIVSTRNDLQNSINQSKCHLQKIGFKRFNPFHETGGNQSFILILLDKDNNGFIITSLHQREATRIYSKFIEKGESKNKLSEEEKELLNSTIKKLK